MESPSINPLLLDLVDLPAQVFDAAPNGFLLIDGRGVMLAANQELCRMFGLDASALIGDSVDRLLPESFRGVHADHRRGFFEAPSRRRMGEGRVLHALHADGHTFPVEIGLTPLAARDGTRLVLASVVDLSERHDLAVAFQGLFDASPYGLLLVDDGGRIEQCNVALGLALGHSPEALRGRPLSDLLPTRYRDGHEPLMRSYTRAGGARMMGQGRDLTALHADGTEVPVEIGLNRVRWKGQSMTLAVMTSIGLRKRLENELRQANADLQEFSYVASHDLRSPLRGIADLVEWIGEDLAAGNVADAQRNLARVAPRIQRMELLIDDLLRYARAGNTDTDFRPISLHAIVADILELQPLPEGFELDTSELEFPRFQGVPVPLTTVLRNLVANAVKHHDRTTGRIRIAARSDGDNHVLITVTDDGPGIPPQSAQRVFKLFQTLSSRHRGGPSGIGLALCKRITESNGGRIDVLSPVEAGRGSRFCVWWPMYRRRSRDE